MNVHHHCFNFLTLKGSLRLSSHTGLGCLTIKLSFHEAITEMTRDTWLALRVQVQQAAADGHFTFLTRLTLAI